MGVWGRRGWGGGGVGLGDLCIGMCFQTGTGLLARSLQRARGLSIIYTAKELGDCCWEIA